MPIEQSQEKLLKAIKQKQVALGLAHQAGIAKARVGLVSIAAFWKGAPATSRGAGSKAGSFRRSRLYFNPA